MIGDEFSWADKSPKEIWKNYRRAVSIFANEPLRDNHGCPLEQANAPRHFDKYERLAFRFLADFQKSLYCSERGQDVDKNLREFIAESRSTELGYLVCGRMAKHGVGAYLSFCLDSSEDPSIDELKTLLLSQGVLEHLNFLASMKSSINRTYETQLSLRTQTYGAIQHNLIASAYEVSRDDTGVLLMHPKQSLINNAEQSTRIMRDVLNQKEALGCPAANVVIPRLWRSVVLACATDEQYFQSDFANFRALTSKP